MQRDEHSAATAPVEITEEAEPSISLEDLVTDLPAHPVTTPAVAPAVAPSPAVGSATIAGLRTARIASLDHRRATIVLRGSSATIAATIAPDVERELIEEAAAHKDAVLVEPGDDGAPVIVGVVQTRKPREVHVTGEKIVVEGSREVLIRAGRAALRLREDGDVELVGSRISAASRGLFRIVGRILRLN